MWGQTRMAYVLLFVISATFRNLYRCWISRQLLLKCSPLFYSLKHILKKMSLTAKRSFHLLLMLKSLLIRKPIIKHFADLQKKKQQKQTSNEKTQVLPAAFVRACLASLRVQPCVVHTATLIKIKRESLSSNHDLTSKTNLRNLANTQS